MEHGRNGTASGCHGQPVRELPAIYSIADHGGASTPDGRRVDAVWPARLGDFVAEQHV